MTISLIGISLVFVLLLLGVPIGIGMAIIGTAGFGYIVGLEPTLSMLGQITYETPVSYSLTIIPLFILMGNFISRAGLSQGLYDAAYSFLGHYRGGLALATLAACGSFSAVSGSSLATAATMSKVAMPQMRSYKYSDSLATGVIAAGGTLGILIPPSVLLVLYGIMTNNDIGKLFVAGIIPGVIALLMYGAAIAFVTARD
ncbi:MAG TPA: C4-dicarboxylate ABC transporter permease, partial [Methylophaga sp.]|nr:C4-dicarboxylate ABC transporter permease [Methylophaga sp.]